MPVDVEKRLYHKVLALVGETLAELLKLDEAFCTLIKCLNILTCRHLALLLDALFAHVLADLMRVGV